jgi:hypothetical protein
MCLHYLCDPDFCNVSSGWGKGIVEKNVQDSRRRIWLDAQNCMFHTLEELNTWLGQRCRALWSEPLHPHVLMAVELVLESGSLSADHILNVLARLTSTAATPFAEKDCQV